MKTSAKLPQRERRFSISRDLLPSADVSLVEADGGGAPQTDLTSQGPATAIICISGKPGRCEAAANHFLARILFEVSIIASVPAPV